ncbi:MAG: sensor domain-containing diguanylate cyclase [Proteobacteria bacterium]|nr:sensor domain-containing diguanylate cyclase [Pseudomonadota bacterium]
MSNSSQTHDATALNAQLDRRLFELESLLKAGEALQGELDVFNLCNLLMTMVRERVRADQLAVLLNDEEGHMVSVEAVQGLPEETCDLSFPADQGILWSLIKAGEPFSVVDLEGRPRFDEIFAKHELERLEGQLWIPLVMPGAVVGVLSMSPDRDGKAVSASQYQFLNRLASRAALAIHTAVLYRSIELARKDLDRSLHHLSLLFDVTRALSAVQNLTTLLGMIIDRAIEAVDAEKGSLMLFDENTEELAIRVVRLPNKEVEKKINDGEIKCNTFKRGEGVAGQVFDTGVAHRVNNTDDDGNFKATEGNHARSLLCVPLIADDEPIGVINITNKNNNGTFENEDEEILTALADQAAVAIGRARLYEAAITDGLTGLFIRRFAMHRMNEEIKKARRYGHELGIVMCDIDHFKAVNDTWGHPAGDAIIIAVAQELKNGLRIDVDIVGRYGGEEFLLVMPATDLEGTRVASDRCRQAIEDLDTDVGGGRKLKVTMSFGATSLGPNDTAETVLKRADEALYVSKEGGRNVVSVLEPGEGDGDTTKEETVPDVGESQEMVQLDATGTPDDTAE